MGNNPTFRGICLSKSILNGVLSLVESETGISAREMLSESRRFPIAHARHYAMWIIRSMTRNGEPCYSLEEIGRAFGRDHTTVIHGVRKHQERLAAQQEAA